MERNICNQGLQSCPNTAVSSLVISFVLSFGNISYVYADFSRVNGGEFMVIYTIFGEIVGWLVGWLSL